MGDDFRAHLISATQTRINGRTFSYDRAPAAGAVWQWDGAAIPLGQTVQAGDVVMQLVRRASLAAGTDAAVASSATAVAAEAHAAVPAATASAEGLGAAGFAGMGGAAGRAANERANRAARRLFRGTAFGRGLAETTVPEPAAPTIWLQDILRVYRVSVHRPPRAETGRRPAILMFEDGLPPTTRPLRVIGDAGYDRPGRRCHAEVPPITGFSTESSVLTPQGFRRVEELSPGDTVLGPGETQVIVRDVRHRKLTGARLLVTPDAAPVRLTLPAPLPHAPEGGLRLAANQRVLFRGALPRRVFGEEEVLIEARALARHGLAEREPPRRRETFVDIVLDAPRIICVDGLDVLARGPQEEALSSAPPRARLRRARLRSAPRRATVPDPLPARALTEGEAEILLGGTPLATSRGPEA